MNILYVVSHYYPYIGGVEYVVKSIAERLVKLGHEVTVIAGMSRIKNPKCEEINKVYVVRWPTWSPGDAYHIPKMRNQLISLLKKFREVDIIHIHSAHAVLPVYVGLQMKNLFPDKRLIFTLHYHGHGHTIYREIAWRILWRKVIKKLVKQANRIHAVSMIEVKHILKHYPHIREKIVIIPNGVDEDIYKFKWIGSQSDYLIYAGRIEKYKKLEIAIDLAYLMKLRILIIGKGPYKNKLIRYVKRNYNNYYITFLRPQPRENYLKLLSKARYAINPSEDEAFSLFVAEAMAIGVPVIASKNIAKAIGTLTLKSMGNLFLLKPVKVPSWSEVVNRYLKELYTITSSL